MIESNGSQWTKEVRAEEMGVNEGGDLILYGENKRPVVIVKRGSWDQAIDKASQEKEKAE